MIHNYKKRVISLGLATIMCCLMIPINIKADSALENTYSGNITVDGSLSDWSNVTAQTSSDGSVTEWKVAYSADRSRLYLSYQGSAASEWDYNYLGNHPVQIQYTDGSLNGGNNTKIQFSGWNQQAEIKDGWYNNITDAVIATVNEAHGNTAGPYTVEASIPSSYFANADYTLTFAGNSISSTAIASMNGVEQPDHEEEAVYRGITIDGSFSDWNAVSKSDAACTNSQHPGCLASAAMVFDGDYVYIYLKDGLNGSASGAGNYSNGKYSVTTDLGHNLVFQLMNDGSVNGIEGATSAHVGKQWEIAIPADKLPSYTKTISFGLYQSEPFVKDISNLVDKGNNGDSGNGNAGGNAGSFSGIDYDGLYGDWKAYPHSIIQYATAGTHENVADAEGALYSDGSTMYGHVVTTMPAHLQEAGGSLTQAVTIRLNQQYNFYPRYAAVDKSGKINWNPVLSGLQNGTYEFYIFSSDAWHTSESIDHLNDADQWYGKIMITISDNSNECEYYIDLDKIAKRFQCDTTDIKEISAQYGRLGQEWITVAGASSGAWPGILICLTVTGGILLYRRKKKSGA